MKYQKPRLTELTGGVTLTAEIFAAGDTERTFIARLLTYGEETRDWRNLSFAEGSLVVDEEPVPLAYAHQTGGGMFGGKPIIVGKSLRFWDEDGAAFAEFSVAETEDATEVWELIEHGALGSVSIGGLVSRFEYDEETEAMTVLAFDLMEVSVVPVPAMKSAKINHGPEELVTLSQEEEPQMEPTELEARLAAIEDQNRAILEAQTEPTPVITGTARGGNYTSPGDVIADAILMDRSQDAAATDRLGALIESGAVSMGPDGTRLIDVFAFADPGDSGDALSSGAYVDGLLGLLRDGMVTAGFMASGNLDDVPGTAVDTQKVAQGNLVDYQTEGGAVATQNQTWGEDTYPKITLAGGQGITVQARDWSRPSYMSEVVEDLVAAYGEKLNTEVVNGLGTAGPPVKMTGILVAQTDRINAGGADATAQAKALIAGIGAGKAAVYTGSKRWPAVLIAPGDVFGAIDGWTDSEGRPLLATDGPMNAIGTESGAVPVGRIRGLMCYADDAVPAEHAIISSFRDSKLWQSAAAPAQVGLVYPDVLTVDVAVYGYSAFAIRRPAAYAVLENIGAAAAAARAKK